MMRRREKSFRGNSSGSCSPRKARGRRSAAFDDAGKMMRKRGKAPRKFLRLLFVLREQNLLGELSQLFSHPPLVFLRWPGDGRSDDGR
ncbi:hypothetical protein NL676_018613 [Syzygium grande]|nr:hypothetical protein NL676_018613 [Syzygium grande]